MYKLITLVLFLAILSPCNAALEKGRFPHETFALKDLKNRGLLLQANDHRLAKEIEKQIELHLKDEATYHRATKMTLPGASEDLKASYVPLERQHYILSSCPRTAAAVRHYFEKGSELGVQVYISLLESKECKNRANNFWKDKLLHLHPDLAGYIQVTSSKVFCEKGCKIVETELKLQNGKKVVHFHHEDWKDHHPAPEPELLARLADRVKALTPRKDVPIAINCKGGVGRTGTFAIYYYLRQEIDKKLREGKKLESIRINIPETIYKFRRYRYGILGNEKHLAQLHILLHSYYLEVKSTSERPLKQKK